MFSNKLTTHAIEVLLNFMDENDEKYLAGVFFWHGKKYKLSLMEEEDL